MRTWFTLIETRGLTIRAHYTWLLALVLGLWSLTRGILPARFDDETGVWLPALVILALYVAVVAVHEAAHLLAAKLLRVPMVALNVHPIGTLARVRHEGAGPGKTFVIAAAGPLANLVLWFLLGRVQVTPETLGAEFLSFARAFNLTLALINLLPGLPLDGGRMLRAVVWFGTDYDLGTRVATIGGYVVAGITLLVGLGSLFDPGSFLRGLWLIGLAWLIYEAGTSLLRRRTVGTLFKRLTAGDVMLSPEQVTEPQMLLRDVVTSWRGQTGENPTPVVQDGVLLGLMTYSRATDVPQGYWGERPVSSAMIPVDKLSTVTPDTPLAVVLGLVDPDVFHALPLLVIDGDRLVGLIEPRELHPLLDVQDVLGMSSPSLPSPAVTPVPTAASTQTKQMRPTT